MTLNYVSASELPDFTGSYISDDRYLLTAQIGTGGFSRVYKAHDLTAPVRYAVKCMARYIEGTKLDLDQKKEIEIHQYLSDQGVEGVVPLYDVVYEQDWVFLVMEYCIGGDLWTSIVEEHRYHFEQDLICNIFTQVLDTVERCHALGIYHRDLKPENILLSRDGDKAYLADFGLATRETSSTTFCVGTRAWMAPEVLRDLETTTEEPYSPAQADIYSLGIILVNLVTCRLPFRCAAMSCKSFLAFLQERNYLRKHFPISEGLNELLDGMLNPYPERRSSIQTIRDTISSMETLYMSPEDVLCIRTDSVILNFDALMRPEQCSPNDYLSSRSKAGHHHHHHSTRQITIESASGSQDSAPRTPLEVAAEPVFGSRTPSSPSSATSKHTGRRSLGGSFGKTLRRLLGLPSKASLVNYEY